MDLSTKQKIGIIIVYTVICVGVGYYITPEKVKIVKEEVKTENKAVDKKENVDVDLKKSKNTKTTIVEETLPDGTKRKTTVVDSSVDTDKNTKKDTDTKTTVVKTDTSKESETITRGNGTLSLGVLAGVDVTNPNGMIYGGIVQKNVLGPVSIGLFGLSNGVAGCSLGLQF